MTDFTYTENPINERQLEMVRKYKHAMMGIINPITNEEQQIEIVRQGAEALEYITTPSEAVKRLLNR